MSNKFFSNNFDTSDSSADSDEDSDIVVSNKINNKEELKQNKNKDSSDSENNSDSEENSKENNNDKNIDTLKNLNKLITLRYIKDGKASRTYIVGLEDFFTEEELNKLIKDIQKKLSTGYFKNKETNNHGFNGDHRLIISKLLINNYNIAKNKIKVC